MLAWSAGRGPLPARVAQVILLVPRREEVVEVLVCLQNTLRATGAAPNDTLLHWKKVGGWLASLHQTPASANKQTGAGAGRLVARCV